MLLDWLKPLTECPSLRLSACISKTEQPSADLDEVLVLENKVVQALTRLQKSSFNSAESEGVNHSKIVDYLSKKYGYLDGDVESQVITALQSGIKKGFVCGLINGNYSLVGPSTDKMIAQCYNSIYHGPKCMCFLITMGKRHCCTFKFGPQADFVKQEAKGAGKKKSDRLAKRQTAKRSVPGIGNAAVSDCGDSAQPDPASSVAYLADTGFRCGKKRKVLCEARSSIALSVTQSFCDAPV